MFQRRKILLAILEACGGKLASTDMEKLLFLYCKEREINYYDFFPYKFGGFSFVSYQDKRVLMSQRYLADIDRFELKRRIGKLAKLEAEEHAYVRAFVRKTKHLRGDSLVRHVYLENPYFAIRSEIKNRLLSEREQEEVEKCQPKDGTRCLMTIGYEGLTIDAYINKLIRHNISLVVDVRRNPISMKYGFSKTRLSTYLSKVGIAYEHIPALGIESSRRKSLQTKSDFRRLFREYMRKDLRNKEAELERIDVLLHRHQRVALTCFEEMAASCHRHKITERLAEEKGWDTPIHHIQ